VSLCRDRATALIEDIWREKIRGCSYTGGNTCDLRHPAEERAGVVIGPAGLPSAMQVRVSAQDLSRRPARQPERETGGRDR
jgi:hypothetical protein